MTAEPDHPPLADVRLRRVARTGILRRRLTYEVEILAAGSEPLRTTTTTPYSLLRPILGWDEAALLEQRARKAGDGAVGPWVKAYSG